MTAQQTASVALRAAFEPNAAGVVGIAEVLLGLACERDVILVYHDGRGAVVSLGLPSDPVPLRKSVFRAVIARIAALCDAREEPDSVTPYGGVGKLVWRDAVLAVRFTNTPDEQSLQVARVAPATPRA